MPTHAESLSAAFSAFLNVTDEERPVLRDARSGASLAHESIELRVRGIGERKTDQRVLCVRGGGRCSENRERERERARHLVSHQRPKNERTAAMTSSCCDCVSSG